MIELCFKECDNMLAAKITIQNVGIPFSDEFGVNEKFLNAMLEAMTGNLEELRSFDPTNQYAEEGSGLKYELLTSFLAVKDLKPQVRNINLRDNETQLLEVVFQLGYLRKVKFYFQAMIIKPTHNSRQQMWTLHNRNKGDGELTIPPFNPQVRMIHFTAHNNEIAHRQIKS